MHRSASDRNRSKQRSTQPQLDVYPPIPSSVFLNSHLFPLSVFPSYFPTHPLISTPHNPYPIFTLQYLLITTSLSPQTQPMDPRIMQHITSYFQGLPDPAQVDKRCSSLAPSFFTFSFPSPHPIFRLTGCLEQSPLPSAPLPPVSTYANSFAPPTTPTRPLYSYFAAQHPPPSDLLFSPQLPLLLNSSLTLFPTPTYLPLRVPALPHILDIL